MYIRYLKNIYKVGKFYSITKNIDTHISLTKNGGNNTILIFDNVDIRDYILDEIWNEIQKGSICYDIDKAIKEYSCIKNYNMV